MNLGYFWVKRGFAEDWEPAELTNNGWIILGSDKPIMSLYEIGDEIIQDKLIYETKEQEQEYGWWK